MSLWEFLVTVPKGTDPFDVLMLPLSPWIPAEDPGLSAYLFWLKVDDLICVMAGRTA